MKNSLFVVAFFVVLAGCTNADKGQVAGLGTTAKLIGGKEAGPLDLIAKSTVQIVLNVGTKTFLCTGEVLGPQTILTAGHCVTNAAIKNFLIPAEGVSVIDGDLDDGDRIGAAAVLVNPMYLSLLTKDAGPLTAGHDLAVIQLKSPLKVKNQPVVIASLEQAAGQKIFAAGFGRHSQDMDEPSDGILRHGELKLDFNLKNGVNLQEFPSGSHKYIQVDGTPVNSAYARILQFKNTGADAGLCHGDSGGPVYFEKDGRIYLLAVNAGIISILEETCSKKGQSENATLLANRNLQFVMDSVLKLNGTKLSGLDTISAAQDPNRFEYYFDHPGTPVSKARFSLDVSFVKVNNPKGSPIYLFVPNVKSGENICNHLSSPLYASFSMPSTIVEGDQLSSFIRVIDLSVSPPVFKADLEVHLKKLPNDEVQAVMLTPDGYIANTIKTLECK